MKHSMELSWETFARGNSIRGQNISKLHGDPSRFVVIPWNIPYGIP